MRSWGMRTRFGLFFVSHYNWGLIWKNFGGTKTPSYRKRRDRVYQGTLGGCWTPPGGGRNEHPKLSNPIKINKSTPSPYSNLFLPMGWCGRFVVYFWGYTNERPNLPMPVWAVSHGDGLCGRFVGPPAKGPQRTVWKAYFLSCDRKCACSGRQGTLLVRVPHNESP